MELGKVYLVGAGPGDPDLLTIKARDLIAAIRERYVGAPVVRNRREDVASRAIERRDDRRGGERWQRENRGGALDWPGAHRELQAAARRRDGGQGSASCGHVRSEGVDELAHAARERRESSGQVQIAGVDGEQLCRGPGRKGPKMPAVPGERPGGRLSDDAIRNA